MPRNLDKIMAKTRVKICGIIDSENLLAACQAGAHFIGFVFYPPSPRAILPKLAGQLIRQIPTGIKSVGLFVDPTDDDLQMTLDESPVDMIQLHGHESPMRCAAIKDRFGLPVLKALPIRIAADIEAAYDYEDKVDWLLFDAKPESNDSLPGGTGKQFDWGLLENKKFKKPWMLSGGLDANHVKEALSRLAPDAVDVSSGVESKRGVKDAKKITEFIMAVKSND